MSRKVVQFPENQQEWINKLMFLPEMHSVPQLRYVVKLVLKSLACNASCPMLPLCYEKIIKSRLMFPNPVPGREQNCLGRRKR